MRFEEGGFIEEPGAEISEATQEISRLNTPGNVFCLRQIIQQDQAVRLWGRDTVGGSCNACDNLPVVENGLVDVPGCHVSGQCEDFWVHRYSQEYIGDDGKPIAELLKCANCVVYIALKNSEEDGQLRVETLGECRIVEAGIVFHLRGSEAFNEVRTHRPEDGLEEFDGDDGQPFTDRVDQTWVASCTGLYLAARVISDSPPAPGTYVCPRSVVNGEHCNQLLTVDEEAELHGQDGKNWTEACLVNQSGNPPTSS